MSTPALGHGYFDTNESASGAANAGSSAATAAPLAKSNYSVALGPTYTVPIGATLVRLNQSVAVDASTITLPVAVDGQAIQFVNYGGVVTALSFSPTVQGWGQGALFAVFSGLRVRWDDAAGSWYREQ